MPHGPTRNSAQMPIGGSWRDRGGRPPYAPSTEVKTGRITCGTPADIDAAALHAVPGPGTEAVAALYGVPVPRTVAARHG